MNAESLGWEPIFYSWVNTLPAAIQDVNKQEITSLVLRFCPILLWFIRNGDAVVSFLIKCMIFDPYSVIRIDFCHKEMLQTFNSNLIISLLNIFDCFLDEYNDDKYITTLSELDIRAQLEGIFFFSCVWSLGGPLNESSRERFSELFHGLSNKEFPLELYEKYQIPNQLKVTNLQKPYIFAIPKTGNIFDYRFIKEGKGKWKQWSDEIALSPPLARDIPVNQIIITTVETVRICALLDLLIRHGKPVLLVGPTATGKSIYAMDYLTKKMDLELYTALPMNFSAHSHANETQDIIMAKLDKRRKGVFGPPLGKKCVIFIDDLSMPLHEPFGAQSSVELMRMLLDHWMWYDRKDNVPYKLIDLQLVSAMGPPKVTGNSVTSRFTRHFNTMAIDEFSNDVLKSIFSKIVLWHLDAR